MNAPASVPDPGPGAPRVLVLHAPGTNCTDETVHAFRLAGARAERVPLVRLLDGSVALDDHQVLAIPGGFSHGDDVAAGKVFAVRLLTGLGDGSAEAGADRLRDFVARGGAVLGICNGFQVLVKAGILPDTGGQGRVEATLGWSRLGRYTDRWVHLRVDAPHCVFLQDVERLDLPIAHAEGRFEPADEEVGRAIESHGHVALRYTDPEGADAGGVDPWNPNGSWHDVAGVCDRTGRVLGLMPHPERFLVAAQHPLPAGDPRAEGAGLQIFRSAVRCLSVGAAGSRRSS